MDLTDIRTLYAYNHWANERMFSVLDKLTDQQFAAPVHSSFPSIRETVMHIFFAEWLWLKRWQGTSPRSSLSNPDASTAAWSTLTPSGPSAEKLKVVSDLKAFAASVDEERNEFLRGLREDVLQAPLQYSDMAGKPFALPLVQVMQHLVNHGTYHRGQVTTMLRQSDGETIGLDMVYFFRERAGQAAQR